MIILSRVLLGIYLVYALLMVDALVRHDRSKGRAITALRFLCIVSFVALWPLVLAVGLGVALKERHA